MKKSILPVLFFTISLGAVAGDWPRWRGVNHDDISRETGLLQTWPSGAPKRIWLSRDIGIGYSAPVVAKGRLFVMGTKGGKEQLFAKEAKSGKPLWTAALGGILSNNWGDGPRGAATVDGDQVYALGAKGGLICANAGDGKVNWRVELVEDLEGKVPGWGYTESVLVDGRFRLNHNPSAFRWWSGLVYFRSAFKPEPQACEISCSEAFFSPLFSKDNHEDKILFIQFK